MPTYAYRWADGSVSVCTARDKTEAAQLFDRIEGVSRKLVIRLTANIFITVRPHIDKSWVLDGGGALGEELNNELERRCFPHYSKILQKHLLELEEKMPPSRRKAIRRKLRRMLQMDTEEARRRLYAAPVPPDIVALFPKGLAGQDN